VIAVYDSHHILWNGTQIFSTSESSLRMLVPGNKIRSCGKSRLRKDNPNAGVPSLKSILCWHSSLFDKGTVLDKKHQREKTVTTEELRNAVVGALAGNPNISMQRLSNLFQVSLSSIYHILHGFKFHPYKLQILHALHENDLHLRSVFCMEETLRIANDLMHLTNLLQSDKANFHLSSAVNKQNFCYWSDKNPHWITEAPLHSLKVIVWAAVGVTRLIGPIFFDGTINGQRYLHMLQTQFWPQLDDNEREEVRFMQDGAPPHWLRKVRNWLEKKFPGCWMGCGSANIPWPPHSPDLTMCDFFLWGYIKSLVYRRKLENVEEMKAAIIHAFARVTDEMREKAALDHRRRLAKCQQLDGGHVEMDIVHKF
jgi:hypothetical protein